MDDLARERKEIEKALATLRQVDPHTDLAREFVNLAIKGIEQGAGPMSADEIRHYLIGSFSKTISYVVEQETDYVLVFLLKKEEPTSPAEPSIDLESALEEIGVILRKYGITYDELMEAVNMERARTIRTLFPSLEKLYREVNPDGEIVS